MAKYSVEELKAKLTALKGQTDEGAIMVRSLITSELNRRQNSGRPSLSNLTRSEQVRYAVQKHRAKDKP